MKIKILSLVLLGLLGLCDTHAAAPEVIVLKFSGDPITQEAQNGLWEQRDISWKEGDLLPDCFNDCLDSLIPCEPNSYQEFILDSCDELEKRLVLQQIVINGPKVEYRPNKDFYIIKTEQLGNDFRIKTNKKNGEFKIECSLLNFAPFDCTLSCNTSATDEEIAKVGGELRFLRKFLASEVQNDTVLTISNDDQGCDCPGHTPFYPDYFNETIPSNLTENRPQQFQHLFNVRRIICDVLKNPERNIGMLLEEFGKVSHGEIRLYI